MRLPTLSSLSSPRGPKPATAPSKRKTKKNVKGKRAPSAAPPPSWSPVAISTIAIAPKAPSSRESGLPVATEEGHQKKTWKMSNLVMRPKSAAKQDRVEQETLHKKQPIQPVSVDVTYDVVQLRP